MKRVLLAALISCPALGATAWLEPVPPSAGPSGAWAALPAEAFFEVPVSRLATVEAWLADTPFLVQDNAKYFGRPDFSCSPPSKIYLVRAAYMNGGTGRFGLSWFKSTLIVSHASLGPGGKPMKSGLVACLDKAPTAVYSALSGAL